MGARYSVPEPDSEEFGPYINEKYFYSRPFLAALTKKEIDHIAKKFLITLDISRKFFCSKPTRASGVFLTRSDWAVLEETWKLNSKEKKIPNENAINGWFIYQGILMAEHNRKEKGNFKEITTKDFLWRFDAAFGRTEGGLLFDYFDEVITSRLDKVNAKVEENRRKQEEKRREKEEERKKKPRRSKRLKKMKGESDSEDENEDEPENMDVDVMSEEETAAMIEIILERNLNDYYRI